MAGVEGHAHLVAQRRGEDRLADECGTRRPGQSALGVPFLTRLASSVMQDPWPPSSHGILYSPACRTMTRPPV